ncbi:MAG: hypothetical protein LBH03_02680 [Holophagales bacterium]|nr:hypothetical protein [Holophagales bacterium]
MTDDSNTQKPLITTQSDGTVASSRRWASVLLRSIHISAMGVVLGGVFLGAVYETLNIAIWMTVISGCLMMSMDIFKDPKILLQGSGLAVILKLILLAIGFFFLPEQRFGWYLSATFVASVGSHMPGALRHWDISRVYKKSRLYSQRT